MIVKLTKDWAGFKKGETYETKDESVLQKGFELKLFEAKKETVKEETKTKK